MGRYINDIKEKYIENLATYNQTKRAEEIIDAPMFSPIYKHLVVHEDEQPNVQEHNTMLSEIAMDINALNAELSDSAYSFYNLLSNYENKFNTIKDTLEKEKEIQSDLNILCNAYTAFDDIININSDVIDINEDATTDNIIHLPVLDNNNIPLTVTNISGNGYAGNKHVYNKSQSRYISETIDSSKQEYITNNVSNQYYEYSRLISSDIQNASLCSDVNNDSNAVRCTMYLTADDVFNTLQINSTQKYLRIVDLYTSLDGLSYSVLPDFHNFDFNNTDNTYTINNYILNSGVFNIPDSKYVKITFESFDYNASETLAYQNKQVANNTSPHVTEKTVILNNTQRYYVKINSIQAYRKNYDRTYSITSDELITNNLNKIDSLALFSNEYVPNVSDTNNTKNYIQYYFIINDKEYEITPINKNVNTNDGKYIKIIRASNNLTNSQYTEYINDDIKSIKFKLVMSAINEYNSPYVSNIKILKGERNNI